MKLNQIAYLILIVFVHRGFSQNEEDLHMVFGEHDLISNTLAKSWDEGMPLGNAVIGSLVWEKEGRLRMSLDNVNLWDLRPMENLNTPEYKFSWVYEQWKNDNYKAVQDKFDAPYDRSPAPSKIPGAGLEFNIDGLGKVDSTRLSVKDAACKVNWSNGTEFQTFVHASEKVGWFKFKNVPEGFKPILIPPAYNIEGESKEDSPVTGQDLRRLEYPEGKIVETENEINYTQEGWGGFSYKVSVKWQRQGNGLEGCWSISAHFPENRTRRNISRNCPKGMAKRLPSRL